MLLTHLDALRRRVVLQDELLQEQECALVVHVLAELQGGGQTEVMLIHMVQGGGRGSSECRWGAEWVVCACGTRVAAAPRGKGGR